MGPIRAVPTKIRVGLQDSTDMAGSYNGGAVVTDATGAMPTALTTTRLGKLVAATMWERLLAQDHLLRRAAQ